RDGRQGGRSRFAHALRRARTCYDHLAGRLGVALLSRLIEDEAVVGGDGRHHPERAREDRLSARGHDVQYRLTSSGRRRLLELGVPLPRESGGDTPLRYCVDWTEQAHHLSGNVGRALTNWMLDRAWLERLPRTRALLITDAGERELRDR